LYTSLIARELSPAQSHDAISSRALFTTASFKVAMNFQRLGVCDKPVDAHFGGPGSPLATAVSGHFRGVIKKGTHDVSLFRQTWLVCEPDADGRLFDERELRSPLTLRTQDGAAPACRVRMQVSLPSAVALAVPAIEPTLRAWVLGKILNWSVESDVLFLKVKAIAVLRDYAHQH
jgi:hypothetical protein